MKQEDQLWKGLLEEIFSYFIKLMMPNADEVFDFSRDICFRDKELAEVPLSQGFKRGVKVVDKLASVYTREGKEQWILVHVEVQSEYNTDFPQRMYTYYRHILNTFGRRVIAWAILTEPCLTPREGIYEEDYYGTGISYRYNVYKISLQDEEELLASENPFAAVVLMAKYALKGKSIKNAKERDEFFMTNKLALIKRLYAMNLDKKTINAVINFILHFVDFEFENTSITFETNFKSIKGGDKPMGIEEQVKEIIERKGIAKGRAKGRAEGQALIVRNLIVKLGLSDEKTAEIAGVSVNFVKKIRASIK